MGPYTCAEKLITAYSKPNHSMSIVYQNIQFAGQSDATTFKVVGAEKHVAVSGDILEKSEDYYVGVSRVSFQVALPICIAPLSTAGLTDGLSTIFSLSMRHVDAGVTTWATAELKLQPETPQPGISQVAALSEWYATFWSVHELAESMNEALADCFAQLVAAAVILPATGPFVVSAPDQTPGKFRFINKDAWAFWNQTDRTGLFPELDLFCSAATYPLFSGWGLGQVTDDNAPLDPNGGDFKFQFGASGSSWDSATRDSLLPVGAGPFDFIHNQQQETQTYPGVERFLITTDMSVVGERVATNDRSTTATLTDFLPDLTNAMSLGTTNTKFIYNAGGVDETRLHKISGHGALDSFNLRLITRDWLGNDRVYRLSNVSQTVSLKLAYVPRKMVESNGYTLA